MSFEFTVPGGGPVTLAIYDATGRRVRGLLRGVLEPGEYRTRWDTRDDRGVRVSQGAYWASFSDAGRVTGTGLIVLR